MMPRADSAGTRSSRLPQRFPPLAGPPGSSAGPRSQGRTDRPNSSSHCLDARRRRPVAVSSNRSSNAAVPSRTAAHRAAHAVAARAENPDGPGRVRIWLSLSFNPWVQGSSPWRPTSKRPTSKIPGQAHPSCCRCQPECQPSSNVSSNGGHGPSPPALSSSSAWSSSASCQSIWAMRSAASRETSGATWL
jgi:hypothetical protein